MQNKVRSIISTSILNCDLSNLFDECQQVIKAGSDWLHIDIMDGHFVPNLSFGPPVVQALNDRYKNLGIIKPFFDCHCMVSNPDRWIEPLTKAGADMITIHYESDVRSYEEISENIRKNGMRAGLSIKPKTQLDEQILYLLDKGFFDLVLIMTVEPGFGGQKFMEDMMDKVKKLRERFQNLDIQVDGGLTCDNVQIAAQAGANIIVSGTGILKHKEGSTVAIQQMKESVTKIIEKNS